MKRFNLGIFINAILLLLVMCAPRAFAQNTSIQELLFNDNGTAVVNSGSPDISLSGYDTTTGLGTITFTTTATGSGFFGAGFVLPVSTPFYNEYGTAFGTPLSAESWEIANLDDPSNTAGADLFGNTLDGTNHVPGGGAFDYIQPGCGGAANCNATVGILLGDSFNLDPDYEEIITILVSQTNTGGGFYLDQTHPVDGNNLNKQDVYYSLTATQVPVGTNPNPTPEPGTWLMVLTGMGVGATRLRRRLQFQSVSKFLAGVAVLVAGLVLAPLANAQSVNTVPWDPTNPAAPHTTYPLPIGAPTVAIPATSEVAIVLGATFNKAGSPDSFTYTWSFGDGSPVLGPLSLTNPNDISAIHTYPFGDPVGKNYTAQVTVTDTTTHIAYTGNYLVIQEANNLQTRVNVAIDYGLWYMHQSMYHPSPTTGNWENCASGYSFDCGSGYGSLDATNVQAFEVNGHLASGPATDPYTTDVAEGIAAMLPHLTAAAPAQKTYTYDTANNNFGCSDGTRPLISPSPSCAGTATVVHYNPTGLNGGTYTFDGNSNAQVIYAQQSGQTWGYEDGMYADALVASGTPNATAPTGPAGIVGEKFVDIVQDIADAAAYCQYQGDPYDVLTGYGRGTRSDQGGGWWYSCQSGGDNSVSQWASIGLIGASRGFGLSIPKIVTDANNMWVTSSQDLAPGTQPVAGSPQNSTSDAFGAFGYNAAFDYSDAWGPFAVTPSGMVQAAMDGVGRTANTAFGAGSNAGDQRWNYAESYYADNFCNGGANPSYSNGGPYTNTGNSYPYYSPVYTPKNYVYGLFSFTKAMLLHNPGGLLTPIQYLQTLTSGVFNNPANPNPNSIDWYSALSPAHGGADNCDGVAQTLVGRQITPATSAGYSPTAQYFYPGGGGNGYGYWYSDSYTDAQYPYETAWSLIMLKRTVFVNCVNNLGGKGVASGMAPARIDLTWTGIPNVTGYTVERSITNGGPYTQIGTTVTTAYSDRSGLTNGHTYYYLLVPTNGAGQVCTSNQATVAVPNKGLF